MKSQPFILTNPEIEKSYTSATHSIRVHIVEKSIINKSVGTGSQTICRTHNRIKLEFCYYTVDDIRTKGGQHLFYCEKHWYYSINDCTHDKN